MCCACVDSYFSFPLLIYIPDFSSVLISGYKNLDERTQNRIYLQIYMVEMFVVMIFVIMAGAKRSHNNVSFVFGVRGFIEVYCSSYYDDTEYFELFCHHK